MCWRAGGAATARASAVEDGPACGRPSVARLVVDVDRTPWPEAIPRHTSTTPSFSSVWLPAENDRTVASKRTWSGITLCCVPPWMEPTVSTTRSKGAKRVRRRSAGPSWANCAEALGQLPADFEPDLRVLSEQGAGAAKVRGQGRIVAQLLANEVVVSQIWGF